jgi:hypothetical protein
MFEITEITLTGHREVLATAASFIAAKNKVEEMGVLHMEDDSDYPDCADAYLEGGRVVAIQPVGFKVAK